MVYIHSRHSPDEAHLRRYCKNSSFTCSLRLHLHWHHPWWAFSILEKRKALSTTLTNKSKHPILYFYLQGILSTRNRLTEKRKCKQHSHSLIHILWCHRHQIIAQTNRKFISSFVCNVECVSCLCSVSALCMLHVMRLISTNFIAWYALYSSQRSTTIWINDFYLFTFLRTHTHYPLHSSCDIAVTPRVMLTKSRENETTASFWPIYSKRNLIKMQTTHKRPARKKMELATKKPHAAKPLLSLKTRHRKR